MAKNIEMQYYNGSNYEIVCPKTLSTQVIMTDLTNLEDTVTSLKTSVSEGKALVAGAVTDKGIKTASDATFETIANNIASISTGQEIFTDYVYQSNTNYSKTIYPADYIDRNKIAWCAGYGTVTANGTFCNWMHVGKKSDTNSYTITFTAGSVTTYSSPVSSQYWVISILVDLGTNIATLTNFIVKGIWYVME